MTRDPYTRQIWQQIASALRSAAVSCVMAAGVTALITDSDVSGAPTVAAVVGVWAMELIWSGSFIRTAARRVAELREQRALCRTRRMHRRSLAPLEPLPGVDGLTVAHDARVIDEHAHAEEPALVETPQQAPTLGYTALMDPLDSGAWGFTGDPCTPAGPLPYAVRTDFDPAGARTVVAERVGRAA